MADPLIQRSTKDRIDKLFYIHAICATAIGALAYVLPHLFEFFVLPHGEAFAIRANQDSASKLEHTTIRLYGALIVAQGWITWHARKTQDAPFRRALVQAYFGCFVLTTLALLRAQLTEGSIFSSLNWLNIGLFAFLSSAYGWFSLVEKIKAFEGLAKAGN